MLKNLNYKFLFATAFAFGLINSVDLQLPNRYSGATLEFGNAAVAKSRSSSSGSSSRSSSSSSSSRSSSSSSSSSRSSSSTRTSSPSDSRASSSRSSPSTKTASPARASSSAPSAGSTGGRVSGGSFKKPAASSSPVRSQTTTNPPQPTSSQRQTTRPYTPYPNYGSRHVDIDIEIENENPAPYRAYPVVPNAPNSSIPGSTTSTVAPVTASESANASDNGVASLIAWGLAGLFLLSLSAAVILLVYFILKRKKSGSPTHERENDIVTVSQLQVALLATAQGLQSELSELTLTADTETSEGLCQLLQESVLVLLRNSHNWTHVLTSSQSVRSREEADVLFTKLSIEQRSKFSVETLVHVNGRVNHKDVASNDYFEVSADYIVVTLLVGTADDKPLFEEIRSVEALKDALQKVASIQPDYLMTFELLWSPQKETDTLTYEQLLTNYTDMFQIA